MTSAGCGADELSPELQERAAIYASEDLDAKEIIMEEIQTTLKTTVPDVAADENRLLRFLRANEFRIKQTSDCVKAFYKYKANNPELFTPLPLQEARDIVHSGLIGVLPGRDVQGGRVLYVRIGLWDPDNTPMEDLFRLTISLHLKLIQDPETQIGGLRILEDMEGLSWKHSKSLSIPLMRKVSKLFEGAFPARFDGFHNMNESDEIDRLCILILPFFSTRLKGRNHFHGTDYAELYEYIPQENLPELYGGRVTDRQIQDFTMSLLRDYKEDDFGDGGAAKIPKTEDSVTSATLVSQSTYGSYRRVDPS
ncbi:alpha-tocopherol transfer protein-like [Haliotis rubra]|uniref:alpha-tocopherol transfer protein-like n=1 Tax=Haliotis rubra TaxID=36100 RepID=UPI001EE4F0C9|nr:alpha-tocopherol transfer protein-like [Haliotis rubra]